MKATTLNVGLLSVLAALSVACGDDDGTADGDGNGGDMGHDASTGGDGGGDGASDGIQIIGTITDFASGSSGVPADPVPNAEVCIYEMDDIPCATTDDVGAYTITGAPANSELVLTVSAEGHRSNARSFSTADGLTTQQGGQATILLSGIPVVSLEIINEAEDLTGITYAPNKGGVSFGASSPDGVVVTIDPASGDGPFFYDMDLMLDPSLNSLNSPATFGAYINVDPGEVTLEWTLPNGDCTVDTVSQNSGWPVEGDDSKARYMVVPDHTAWFIRADCVAADDTDAGT